MHRPSVMLQQNAHAAGVYQQCVWLPRQCSPRVDGGERLSGTIRDQLTLRAYCKRGGRSDGRWLRAICAHKKLTDDGAEPGPDGRRETLRIKAQWPPLVDVDLLRDIESALGARGQSADDGAKRGHGESFPLIPMCAHCGGRYIGGSLAAKQGKKRSYVHAKPKTRMDQEGRRRYDEQRCKVWCIDAKELETKIVEVILAERSTCEFEAEVKERVRDRLTNGASDAFVAHAETTLKTARRRYELATRALFTVEATDGNQDDDAMMMRVKESKSALRQAKHALEKAKRVTLSADAECDRISLVLERTRVLGNAFASAEPEEKKLLLDAWTD